MKLAFFFSFIKSIDSEINITEPFKTNNGHVFVSTDLNKLDNFQQIVLAKRILKGLWSFGQTLLHFSLLEYPGFS